MSGAVAHISQAYCSGCGICVSIRPYPALELNKKTGKSEIQSVLCKGCGLCVASCRSVAVDMNGFDTPQIMAMIESALNYATM